MVDFHLDTDITYSSWLFNVFWILGGALEAFTTQSCMVLWMKASGEFTVPQNNTYPLGITAIGKETPFVFGKLPT